MADYLKKEINDTDVLCQEVMGMPVKASSEVVTIDDTTNGINNTTAFVIGRIYSLTPDVDCYVAFGTSPVTVAVTTQYYIPAGMERVFLATQTHCSVIRKTADGNLFINLLDGGAN